MTQLILCCNKAGQPKAWITPEISAGYYATKKVLWEAGQPVIELTGGWQNGERSRLTINSIIGVGGVKHQGLHVYKSPNLNNKALFARDKCICLYCGERFATKHLTRDHVMPVSKGGANTWLNCVTACEKCNHRKADRTPEQANMKLLALPYVPNPAEYLILANRNILADQMEFLQSFAGRDMRTRQ